MPHQQHRFTHLLIPHVCSFAEARSEAETIMTEPEIQSIEQALQVRLPKDYRQFLAADRGEDDPDDTTLEDAPGPIIEATQEYRAGFSGLQPWPDSLVYMGDESDACPYVIDCGSGEVRRLDKGNLVRRPLESFPSFGQFLSHRRQELTRQVPLSEQKRRAFLYHVPLVFGLLTFFVILPAIAFGISRLVKWLWG